MLTNARSSNGRTLAFEAGYRGSNPRRATIRAMLDRFERGLVAREQPGGTCYILECYQRGGKDDEAPMLAWFV